MRTHHPTALTLTALEDRAVPATLNPVYTATFADAVTADNAFTARNGQRYWDVDAGADRYQTDTYERPTVQTFEVRKMADGTERFGAHKYFSNLDVVEARAGADDRFLYVSVKLAGLDQLTGDGKAKFEGLVYRYGFRLATQADGGGGLLVTADQPGLKNPGLFGGESTYVYRDANGDVGGTGRDVTKQDRQAEVDGNGYEQVAAADGRAGGRQVLFVRTSPTDPTVVEFALDYQAFGYTAADVQNLAYFTAEANKGLQDPANYLWNDEYTKSEAGSPYWAESDGQGLGNVYELDTVDLGRLTPPLPPPPPPVGTASLAGSVYVDANNNGVRDPDEEGIEGVTIFLGWTDAQGNAQTRQAVTDLDGNYQFTGLSAGTYELVEDQPTGYLDGREAVGTVNGQPRGVLPAVDNDVIESITLGDGEVGVGYDFGERPGGTGV